MVRGGHTGQHGHTAFMASLEVLLDRGGVSTQGDSAPAPGTSGDVGDPTTGGRMLQQSVGGSQGCS